jgi:ubiquinone/menaquinone biosynthesis C-methylase UbiE
VTFLSTFKHDIDEILRCPECAASELRLDEKDVFRCLACEAEFPADLEKGFCVLLAGSSDTNEKTNIQKWWSDLYRQLYDGHEAGATAETMEENMVQVEDLFRKRRLLAVEEMPLHDVEGKRVLEIGPGGGAHSAVFKKHGASVVAVDITAERVAATARKLALIGNGEGRAYQADGENLPFRDDSFDIVYSNGVLHHSENTDTCIAEVRRVLKPGGKAVIMLYSRHSTTYWLNVVPRAIVTGEMFRRPEAEWIGRLTEGKPKHGDTKNPYTRVYSERELRHLFRDFKVLSLRKNSFQFDNFAFPRLTQIRNAGLKFFGYKAHVGGIYVYGAPFVPETDTELWLGRYLGFAWNIVVKK